MLRGLLLILFLTPLALSAQQVNDDCLGSIQIPDISNYCSNPGEFSTVSATASAGDCFSSNAGDVWFTFTSRSNSINIRVLGNVEDEFGLGAWTRGSLESPKLILYSGTCENPELVECADVSSRNIGELFLEDLAANSTYFLKVGGSRAGSFQLCINSFDIIPAPENDCVGSVILCSKQAFHVPFLAGGGADSDELDNTCLDRYNDIDAPGGPFENDSETATAWYKWIIRNTGNLTFTLTPNNPSDDIDFALLRLPNGIEDCAIDNAEVMRCMASGANTSVNAFGQSVLDPLEEWIDCYGPTGVQTGDPDPFEETAGCQMGNNNFVMDVPVVQGEAYLLVVDNFSNSQHGFSIEFGGSSDFIAPQPQFAIDDTIVCVGQQIQLTDQSVGTTGSVMWNFGIGAIPATNDGNPTPQISYGTSGDKVISLIAEGTTGCLTTLRREVQVLEPILIDSLIRDQSCDEMENGRIEIIDLMDPAPITDILWSTGSTSTVLDGVPAGTYTVDVTNAEMCTATFSFLIEEPDTLIIEPLVQQSTCGMSNGQIELTITGQATPFEVDFGTGFGTSTTLENLPADLYDIVVRDAGGCLDSIRLGVNDRDLVVETDFTSPSCFGGIDGTATINVLEGNDPVQFNWNLEGSFSSNSTLSNRPYGTTSVEIVDGLGCRRFSYIEISQPDSLELAVDTLDISCFGFNDGSIIPTVGGGVGGYQYNWSDGSSDPINDNLAEGQYSLTLTDANQCEKIATAFIFEPESIGINIEGFTDVICFGDETGSIQVNPAGGIEPYEFSIDGSTFQNSADFQNLGADNYTVTLRDANNCIDTVSQIVMQPEETFLMAENDTTINLGFSTFLSSTVSPDQEVTYSWSPPEFVECSDCPSTLASPVTTTTFILEITDALGCTVTDPVTVNVVLDRPIFVPNAITPNGDGTNDRVAVFAGPAAAGIQRIQIFDRWGERVYEGTDLPLNDRDSGWDGTFRGEPMNPGVFVYLVEIQFIDAQSLTFTGDITLIR